jgi:Tfp pilus assembly protein PilX
MQTPARILSRGAPIRQRGVIVFIALIVLVAMTLAALSLIRSTDTGNIIAGNLAFKQETANTSDMGLETVYRLLLQADGLGTGALNNDNAFPGYHSQQPAQPENIANYSDPTWYMANGANGQPNGACAVGGCAADANGNVTYYTVHRMCTLKNVAYNVANQLCATLVATNPSQDGNSNSISSGCPSCTPPPQLYYRITTLVVGPRNSESVVQAMLALSN